MAKNDALGEQKHSKAGLAIALVTSLFFVWGLAMQLVNGLNSPLANYLQLTDTEASFLQVAYFGAYFVMAIPASLVAKRFGYKGGIIMGLILFVVGSFITYPATNIANFSLFLIAMFVIASGAASLEANCNPYVAKLGDKKHEAMRLNLSQSFNGIGSIVGPLILALIVGETVKPTDGMRLFRAAKEAFLANMGLVYIVIGIILAIVLLIFIFFRLPEPTADVENEEALSKEAKKATGYGAVLKKPHFALGILALFLYVGIQTVGFATISGFSQNFWFGDNLAAGSLALMVMTILFTIGRFVSVPIMAKVSPNKLLGIYMTCAAICFFVAFCGLFGLGPVAVVAFMLGFLFMSIGYPTIFSLSLVGLDGAAAKTGSSLLVMSIVGGAFVPLVSSAITDATGSLAFAALLCVPCIAYAAWYGFKGSKIGTVSNEQ